MKKSKKKLYYLKYYEEEKDKFNKIEKKEKTNKVFNLLFKAKNKINLNKIYFRTSVKQSNRINNKIILFLISFIFFFTIIFLIILNILKKKSKTNIPDFLIKEEINPTLIEEQKTELKKVKNFIKFL